MPFELVQRGDTLRLTSSPVDVTKDADRTNYRDFWRQQTGRALRAEFADDENLVRGYAAKCAKEFDAAQKLYDPEAMRAAYENAEAACADLERKLASRTTRWMLDDVMTLADLYWGIELLRMKNLDADTFWKDGRLPAVAAFAEQAESAPAIRAAVLDWPGAMF